MAEDLIDEIKAAVHARLRTRGVPEAIWEDAANEVSAETPTHPALTPWITAQIRKSQEAKRSVDTNEIAEMAAEDELLGR